MPALHDLQCNKCGKVRKDCLASSDGSTHIPRCFGKWEILWQTNHQRDAAVHTSERTALLYSRKEKKWQYPATNSQAIPDRLRKRGYERVELTSLHSIEQHEKQAGVRSEKAWFDAGTGRGFDD